MSDRDRPVGDVLELLDRAASDSPPLHLAREDVVARGQQLVRRRRASRAGMSIGGLALAGAVWLGTGLGGGGLLGPQDASPAGVAWHVEEPVTLELLDRAELDDGRTWTVTLSKDATSSTATFLVDGREFVVAGEPGPTGLETFPTDLGTLVVWAGTDVTVSFVPEVSASLAGAVSGEDGAVQWTLLRAGSAPDDVVLSTEERVWTASGEVAGTAELTDGRVRTTVFALPGAGLAGRLQDGAPTFLEPGSLHVGVHAEPWWRGGDTFTEYLVRLPDEATHARVSWSSSTGRTVTGEQVPAVRVGDAAFAVFSFTDDEVPVDGDPTLVHEWSTDARTWHTQETHDATEGTHDATEGVTAGPVGPGGSVVLLGQTYVVATDDHGWPQLLAEDGTVFLSVSDPDGPPTGDAGGVVLWREHWWPWSGRNEVHFAVNGEPVVERDVRTQDAVTITGPAGRVGLVAVPAGS